MRLNILMVNKENKKLR